MALLTLFMTAFVVGLSGAMMPGPMLTLTIGEVSRKGFWAGPLIVAGHALVELILVGSLALGLSYFMQQSVITGSIGLFGGAVLIWMGWGIGRDALAHKVGFAVTGGNATAETTERCEKTGMPAWFSGALTSVANPYWSLWWATVGMGYVVMAEQIGTGGLAAFYTGHILSDLAWYGLVAMIVHTGRDFINATVFQAVLVSCGCFLVLLGGYFLYSGAILLRGVF